ncbi:7852_t:CDS:2, partial [Gigaspora margarita]
MSQREEIEPFLPKYGINIDSNKTTLYKTGTDKQTLTVGAGIN